MRFGAHVSIADNLADAVDRASALGCEAMQIFPGNPRGWRPGYFKADQAAEFRRRRRRTDIRPLAIHLPYLVNLGSPIDRVFAASIGSIQDALAKAKTIEADFVVTHTGSHVGAGRRHGLERIKAGLKELLKGDFGRVKLLLENTAGAGFTVGDRLEEISEIIASTGGDARIGLCLDTCHAYAAGYDLADAAGLREFVDSLDGLIGLQRVGLIHANDSKGALGSRSDRHEHIGKGHIGLKGWRRILREPAFEDQTFIIETPRPEPDDDRRNLATLRGLL